MWSRDLVEVCIEEKLVKFFIEELRDNFLSKMEEYGDRAMKMNTRKYYELTKGLNDCF